MSFNTVSGVDVCFNTSRTDISNNTFSGAVRNRKAGVQNLNKRKFSGRDGILKIPKVRLITSKGSKYR
jgi:hypothetical protein